MKSIPIKSIPEKKLKKAVKEWAEGNNQLEELLWACINNGIETTGCHAGSRPFLDIMANSSNEKIKRMLQGIQEVNGMQIIVSPDGGNPLSGPDFYKPSLNIAFLSTFHEKETNSIFEKMKKSLLDNSKVPENGNVVDALLDLSNFFAEKGSNLEFRMHKDNEKFDFSVEAIGAKRNFEYFNKLFNKAGLELVKKEPSFIDFWETTVETPEEFNEKVTKCKDIIINDWNLESPSEITKDMLSNEKARIMRKKFGDTPDGKKQFEQWLQNERNKIPTIKKSQQIKRMFKKIKQYYRDRISNFSKNRKNATDKTNGKTENSEKRIESRSNNSFSGELKNGVSEISEIAENSSINIGENAIEKEESKREEI